MTENKNFKSLIRQRMRETGENYTSARSALLGQRLPASTPAGENHADENPPVDANALADIELDAALEAFRSKTRSIFLRDGRLTSIPTKRRALVVILLDLLATLEPKRSYAEKELNDHLRTFHPDFARLRRELIDYRYLDRDPHTGTYWVTRELPERSGNLHQEAGALESGVRPANAIGARTATESAAQEDSR